MSDALCLLAGPNPQSGRAWIGAMTQALPGTGQPARDRMGEDGVAGLDGMVRHDEDEAHRVFVAIRFGAGCVDRVMDRCAKRARASLPTGARQQGRDAM